MDAMAATRRRHRFRLNTRTLLDLPYQGSANDTAVTHRLTLLGRTLEINWRMTTLSRAFRVQNADTDAVFVNGVRVGRGGGDRCARVVRGAGTRIRTRGSGSRIRLTDPAHGTGGTAVVRISRRRR
ncbi:hypothetical protein GCM10010287_16400 [Streptomyces variabilis]|uniref:Uncharacterized protein n=1 Tax=Streptomyces variabilis TaxID=67372 RepID=A0ABQ2TWC2_9ACTN|nr:hypothetical protein GCM10010265_27600 [Streptomyces griseoincarnatus]GGT43860.1 hypothetical protein GCM10010287_16400 [Streptomyces variabilis]